MISWKQALLEAWRHTVANPSVASVLLVAGLIYSFYYPVTYAHQVASALPVVIVDLDHSALSRDIVRSAAAVRGIDIVDMPLGLPVAQQQIERGIANAILVIPAQLEQRVLMQKRTDLTLYGNGSNLVRNSAVLGSLAEVSLDAVKRLGLRKAQAAGIAAVPLVRQAQTVQMVSRPLFNTRNGYGSYAVPAVSILIIHQVLMIGSALVICGVGRKQLWLARQTTAHAALFGLSGCFFVAWYCGFVFWLQDYPRGGNGPGLLLAGPLFIAATVAFAMLIGTLFTNMTRALQLLTCSSVPFFFLTGVSWPLPMFPLPLLWLGRLIPVVPGVQAMIKLNQMGATLAETSPELCNLATQALIYGALVYWRLNRQAHHHAPSVLG